MLLKIGANCKFCVIKKIFAINGQKYYPGQKFKIVDDTTLNCLVNYKEPVTETEIAKTGDSIPYALVVGLGLVAVVAFVIARKQFN